MYCHTASATTSGTDGIDLAERLDAVDLAVEEAVLRHRVVRMAADDGAVEVRRRRASTAASRASCAGQHTRLADSRESPLATRQI